MPQTSTFSTIAQVKILSFCIAVVLSGMATAQDFENVPEMRASDVLSDELLRGPNHRVDPVVVNDGYMNHYTIHSNFGRFEVVSTAKLRKRIDEIAALVAMEQVKSSEVFAEALVQGGEDAVEGVANLITDPVNTVDGAVSGVGKIFERTEEAFFGSERSDSEEGEVESLIGFAKQKREYAAEFGVDAYSHNEVLQDELNDIAWTGYLGELAPTAALAAVPGGAGIAISVTQNADMLNEVFKTTAPLDLRKMNRQKLIAMGVNESVAELFIDNSVYTPREQTLLVAALEGMQGVEGREAFVKKATLADNFDLAYFRQRQAQMYAAYHKTVSPVSAFIPIGQITAAQLNNGSLVLVAPLDHLSWTKSIGSYIANADAYINQNFQNQGNELVLSGEASDLARSKLADLGWKVMVNSEDKLLPNLPY